MELVYWIMIIAALGMWISERQRRIIWEKRYQRFVKSMYDETPSSSPSPSPGSPEISEDDF